jgi:hypothetical protein
VMEFGRFHDFMRVLGRFITLFETGSSLDLSCIL